MTMGFKYIKTLSCAVLLRLQVIAVRMMDYENLWAANCRAFESE